MPADVKHKIAHSSPLRLDRQLAASKGHFEKLLVSDKSHVKHGKTYLFAKSLFSGLVGLGEKFEFFEVP
jgi:hypothetical protein